MSLTLCMIVKDEAADLARCVESARKVIDDIVIVDTGSSDATVEIAKGLNARVYNYEWSDDFSAARNAALKYVQTGWVLFMDADEMISQKDHSQILKLTGDERIDGYYLVQRHYLEGAGYDNWKAARAEYPEMEASYPGYAENYIMRLFRSRPDIVFEGRIHESVVCVDSSKRWVTAKTDVVIHHYGKVGDPEQLDRKKKVYLNLGRLKANERPDDAKTWFELGLQLHELGKFEECIDPFKKSFELDPAYVQALYYIGNANFKLGRLKEARVALLKALELNPANADVMVNLAGVERREGNVEKALNYFDRAIETSEDLFAAWFNKAALLLSSGRNAEAEPCFTRALKIITGYTQAMFGQWQNRLLLGKYELAGEEMIEWIESYPDLISMVMTAAKNFLERKDYGLAEKALESLAKTIDSADCYAALGAAQLGLKKTDQAERSLMEALALDERNNDARINLAQLKELYRSDREAAIALYQDALRLDPDHELCQKRLSALRSS